MLPLYCNSDGLLWKAMLYSIYSDIFPTIGKELFLESQLEDKANRYPSTTSTVHAPHQAISLQQSTTRCSNLLTAPPNSLSLTPKGSRIKSTSNFKILLQLIKWANSQSYYLKRRVNTGSRFHHWSIRSQNTPLNLKDLNISAPYKMSLFSLQDTNLVSLDKDTQNLFYYFSLQFQFLSSLLILK